jgi:hypothetical protein
MLDEEENSQPQRIHPTTSGSIDVYQGIKASRLQGIKAVVRKS